MASWAFSGARYTPGKTKTCVRKRSCLPRSDVLQHAAKNHRRPHLGSDNGFSQTCHHMPRKATARLSSPPGSFSFARPAPSRFGATIFATIYDLTQSLHDCTRVGCYRKRCREKYEDKERAPIPCENAGTSQKQMSSASSWRQTCWKRIPDG
uniref:Uncharacterized protein n=1 Tax=Branchiostoma floridae TaxID=7739 RepID=C3XXL2_BRAFL|eukprot:XP_002611462.1 hypothetical protein BRAFLDRAFT_63904 [Branchiostoma floridae]